MKRLMHCWTIGPATGLLRRGLLLVCAASMALPVMAAPIAKIQTMLVKEKILCGRFEQSKQLTGFSKPLLSSGRFCVVADKGVLWRTLQPFPSTLRLTRDEIIHLQGDRVAMRLDAKQEPTVRTINSVLFSLLAGELDKLDSLFEIDGSVQDKQWSVALKAREPGLAKVIGSVQIEGGKHVQNITINEASGDRTQIVFSAMQSGASAMQADEAALF